MIRWIYCALSLLPWLSSAHPVSLTWANARISEDEIQVTFKVLAEDLVYFHHPEPDGFYNYRVDQLQDLAQKHSEVILEYFYITNESVRLPSQLISTTDNWPESSQINVMDLMKYYIQLRLKFKLKDKDWNKLVVHQEFGSHGIGIPSVTFFSAYKNGNTLIENVEVSPGNPLVLRPIQNQEKSNPSELTSSFFTISNAGIRHELTLPATVFNGLVQTGVSNTSSAQLATQYFESTNPIFANGRKLVPRIQLLQSLDKLDEESLVSIEGFVYLDIFYPTKGSFNESLISWTDYTWKFRWFESEIMSIDSSYQHTFSRFQQEFRWKSGFNPEKVED
ncbi:MAG: hypothetical protein RJQ09_03790 [Cyclobacteriaceae bacterium]